jgi:hypothetical protein
MYVLGDTRRDTPSTNRILTLDVKSFPFLRWLWHPRPATVETSFSPPNLLTTYIHTYIHSLQINHMYLTHHPLQYHPQIQSLPISLIIHHHGYIHPPRKNTHPPLHPKPLLADVRARCTRRARLHKAHAGLMQDTQFCALAYLWRVACRGRGREAGWKHAR